MCFVLQLIPSQPDFYQTITKDERVMNMFIGRRLYGSRNI